MLTEISDRIVIITGASGEIGKSLVDEFSKVRAKVYPVDIQEFDHPNFIQGDLTDLRFINRLVNQVMDQEGRIDILVNNAGICPRTPLLDISPKEWQEVMEINLTSLFFLSQAVMKIMMTQKSGNIVNLSSIAGKNGGTTVGAHYCASKAAIGCLTKSFAKTGALHGIRVNAVAPGIIDTLMMHRGVASEKMDQIQQSIPMKRLGTAREVARIILALASDQASYVTGTNLDIDGGLNM